MAEYIAMFKITLTRCSNVTNIKAKFLFEENLQAEVAVQVMNDQPSSLKNSQAVAQRVGSILKYAGKFEHVKKKILKGKKPFFNFV